MKYIVILCLLISQCIYSQEKIKGEIFEANAKNKKIRLAGANVYWLNSSVGAVTDFDGKFTIPFKKEYTKLVVSYIGFQTDTIIVSDSAKIQHWLKPTNSLDEISIATRKKTTFVSFLNPVNMMNVDETELLKAACCNLAESFETNPTVDVNFADAVSGTRQIKMLGLTSPYLLMTTENVPSIRGAAQAYGLSFIPGTWVESIQITKGTGSVVNGFESIAGQINAELKKPLTDDLLFVNAYAAVDGRTEINTHINTRLNEWWSSGLYIHGNRRDKKSDKNKDQFLDMPLAKQFNIMNRWQYANSDNGFVGFFNFNYLTDEKQAGQTHFSPSTDKLTTNAWGSEIGTNRIEVSGKLGYVNPELPYQKLALQLAYSNHKQNSYFGLNAYDIKHQSAYSNLVYNSIISDSRHIVKTGISLTYDNYEELVNLDGYDREEHSVGGFFEYNFDNLDALSLNIGIRLDHHNLLGTFLTPRFNMRYSPWEKSALRLSAGRGKRSTNIFTENQKIFATSRAINVLGQDGEIYGLNPEIAWNYGVSYLQGFNLFERKGDVTVDFYKTDFKNRIILDMENPLEANFYNVENGSYANSFQVELNYNLFEGFDVRMAYKHYDVQSQFESGKKEDPLVPKNRFFVNASFDTSIKSNGAHWRFDITYNALSKQRFTSTSSSPLEFQVATYSPSIATLNSQVTKVFSRKFEIYFGGENITNVRQRNPVISSENPFGSYFDTTFVYGPIFGSSYYAGLRYKIN